MRNRRFSLAMIDLYNEWDSCEKCTRIASCHKVHYRGPSNPLILFIGDTPSLSDTVTKQTFSGYAGSLLNQLAKDCSLPRDRFGVTTLIACTAVKDRHPSILRDPTAEEVDNCSGRLDELIETLLPTYYIALGAVAKKYAPAGVTYSLDLSSPAQWEKSGGDMALSYKRDRHKLKKFLREINGEEN